MPKRVALPLLVVVVMTFSFVGTPSVADTSRIKAAGSSSSGWRWDPTSRTVSLHDKVVWKNPTGKRHTVTAYGGNWSKKASLDPGERTSQIFHSRGTFKFRCMVRGHSTMNDGRCVGMCGKVVVN